MTLSFFLFFFFNDTATTEIYTLSLHDALPIWECGGGARRRAGALRGAALQRRAADARDDPGRGEAADRKSTRLNSSHVRISYAVFCLKKKKKHTTQRPRITSQHTPPEYKKHHS